MTFLDSLSSWLFAPRGGSVCVPPGHRAGDVLDCGDV